METIQTPSSQERSVQTRSDDWKSILGVGMMAWLLLVGVEAFGAETVTMSIPTKTFQQVIYPIARDRGYMKEEGIDLQLTFIEATPSIQALLAGSVQFTGSGTSALVAVAKGGAPLKTVLAVNDRVLQWVLARPNIPTPKDLKGKKIASTGVATAAVFMLRQILTKYGLDGQKDVTIIDPGSNNQLTALLTGVADAAILGPDQRYIALDNGMKELFFFGNEVKNSWGTLATSDRLIKEQPKMVGGFIKATLKALRLIRQDREGTIVAMVKFSGIERPQAARVYDDLIDTFTRNGTVDDETQRNDLVIIRQVAGVTQDIPNARAYDFSFALDADQQLNRTAGKP
ncbi:MAG: ABC transporter substrate-binding protein [Deltaproteobacteria bacterium]|nr:MAG: ABC transporter substrate-binding protein [Deltaproteobacteria bacterium]